MIIEIISSDKRDWYCRGEIYDAEFVIRNQASKFYRVIFGKHTGKTIREFDATELGYNVIPTEIKKQIEENWRTENDIL
jgi:hypothetical protein